MKAKRGRPASSKHGAPTRVLEGRVRDVTDTGDSVVETEQGVVMVSGGLPGEQVRVRSEHTRAGVAHGSLLAVLSPSPERITPACGIAERCGGCPLMSLALDAQRKLKQRRVERALDGILGEGVAVEVESSGHALGYRRRARLTFRRTGNGLALGYFAHGSHHVVDVARCPVLTPALDAALAHVRECLGPSLSGSGAIDLDGIDDARVHVAIRCDAAVAPEVYRACEALTTRAPIVGSSLAVGDGTPARFGAELPAGIARDGLPLVIPKHGFSQINAAVNARLGALVLELAEADGARVLELYAGYGNFTLPLAERASVLLAVESDPRGADACRENLRSRQSNHAHVARVQAADVRELRLRERFDVVVLDPPRGGSPTLPALVAQARPARVVYISCHMTTLQRDLRALQAAGYVADRAHALDMFPQTGHVEAVVRMRSAAK